MVKVFVVQVPVRGSLILRWIKKQLQWKGSELRKRRGGVLSALTINRKEIDGLLTDENNFEAVKVKLTEIMWVYYLEQQSGVV